MAAFRSLLARGPVSTSSAHERRLSQRSGALLHQIQFLWSSQTGSHRIAGGHGLLPLPVLSFVVRRTCERVQPLEAGGGADRSRGRTCRDVPEDRVKPAQVLREVRRPSDDQSSAYWSC